MANIIPLIPENIKILEYAFEHFFPNGTVYASSNTPFSFGKFKWSNRKEFTDDLSINSGFEIKAEDYKAAKEALDKIESISSKSEAKDKKPEETVPEEGLREEQEAERVKREAALKETKEDAERAVRASLDKKQELYKRTQEQEKIKKAFEEKIQAQQQIQESLRNKKVYVKVEIVESPPIPDENINKFIKEAKEYPQSFEKDLAEQIKANITPSLSKNLSENEIDLIAKKTAYDTVSAINNPQAQYSANTQTAILNALSKNPAVLTKVNVGGATAELIKSAASELGFFENSTQLSKSILSSVNNNLAISVFGTGPESLKVSFFDRPIEGYTHEINLDQLNNGYTNLLGSQSEIFDRFGSFGKDQLQGYLLGQARTFLDSQIAKLPADGFISGAWNSEIGQQILSFAGFEKYAPFKGNIWGGLIQKIPGASTFFEGLGSSLGIDFGFTAAVPATELAGTAIVATEGAMIVGEATVAGGATAAAVETGIVAVGVAGGATTGAGIGAILGSIVPGIGTVIVAAIGALVSWIATKIPWKKVGPILLGIGAFFIAGPIAGIVAGLGSYVLIAGVGGGMSAGAIGGGIVGFFGTLGGAVIVAVGVPILITLVVFPIVVALILFIINSGAYVVPPSESSLSSTNPYIDVQKTANPSGSVSSPTPITYTITVTTKKDNLTNIVFTNDCNGIKKGGNKTGCKSLENLPTPPASISPSSPYTFSFTSDYGPAYKDSLVTDSVTVAAKSDSGGDVSETGSASVCFGNCPLDCFDLSDSSWSNNSTGKANLTAAASTLASEYPNFAAKVCAAGTVKLCYTTSNPSPIGAGGMCSQAIFARHIHESNCDINFNQCGIKSQSDALYMLTHESTHHIQAINGSYQQKFDEQVPQSEWALCTYSSTQGNDAESMAEGDALFVGKPSWNGCITNYISQYPKHYLFAKNAMFAP